ncbi:MAG: hypothetical protein NWE95_04565 [Candidatus Bathyarchaeota archaeon]|nr:hypothetical protein [Candidatus Bathyarchaeota archaeon]
MQTKIPAITVLAIILISLALTLTAYSATNVSININSSGLITTTSTPSSSLGVYSDSACTVPLTALDWGSLSPGGTVTKNVYLKNTQGTATLTLGMTTSNWNPTSANGPITVTWNKQGTTLAPGQSTAATLTLTVSSSISGITSFNVQIAITGTA